MSSLTEMKEALQRQTFHGRWTPALAANVNRPRAGLVETLVRAMKRRHTANLLRQLDSRLLDDIEITRGEIDQIAAKAAAEAVVREGAPAMPRIAWLTKLLASILTASRMPGSASPRSWRCSASRITPWPTSASTVGTSSKPSTP